MRKTITCIVLASFFFSVSLPPVSAWDWPWSQSNPYNKDVCFSAIYPQSFWSSMTGKVTIYVLGGAVVALVTYYTAGTGTAAAAGSIATFVGGKIGALMGLYGAAAVNAGLALLGGGSVASGGLGILGGITVLNVIGDVALGIALDSSLSSLPDSSLHHFTDLIKVKPFFDNLSPVIKADLKDFEKALENVVDDPEKVEFFSSRLERALTKEVLNKPDDFTAYNYLMLSILRYNARDFDGARKAVEQTRRFVDLKRSSVLDYIDALLDFSDGRKESAIRLLSKITHQEPDALPPYIILAQTKMDDKHFSEGFEILKRGLENANPKDCSMNWMAGNCLYELRRYEEAIRYYKKALANMSVNEYEALYKLNIAKCYKKMRDSKNGEYWLKDAIAEVDENAAMVSDLKTGYYQE